MLLTGDDPEGRQLRGIARALTQDPAGAADDLMAAATTRRAWGHEEERPAELEAWAAELRRGRNPFTAERLKTIEQARSVQGGAPVVTSP